MKINCIQKIARLFSPRNMFVIFLAAAILLFSSSQSFAPTKMSDAELSDVEGQAMFSIDYYASTANAEGPSIPYGSSSYRTGSTYVVRLWLGSDTDLAAHMGSFKMGYYDAPNSQGDIDTPGWAEGTGWDQNTTNYTWGNVSNAAVSNPGLIWTGVFINFGFDNYTNNATRVLNYIELGTMSASGQVSGTINTINGLTAGGTGTNDGVMLRQTASGNRIINFNNEVMSFVFASKYSYTSGGGTHTGLNGIFIKIPSYHAEDNETHF
jgi:hypothetical protein